jgi:hypothetical protein
MDMLRNNFDSIHFRTMNMLHLHRPGSELDMLFRGPMRIPLVIPFANVFGVIPFILLSFSVNCRRQPTVARPTWTLVTSQLNDITEHVQKYALSSNDRIDAVSRTVQLRRVVTETGN